VNDARAYAGVASTTVRKAVHVNETTATSRALSVEPMSGALGAVVTGVDLREPLGDATFDALHRTLLEHGVIAVRGPEIGAGELATFGSRWGEVIPHPYWPSIEGHPGVLEVFEASAITTTWHSDFTFAERPAMLTMLTPRVLPPVGGDTMFSNQYLAFETLSPGLQQMLLGLRALHRGTSVAAEKGLSQSDVEWVHPVVRVHPETGRPALYVNANYTKRFDGMTEEESQPLLEYLYRHAVRPEFTCRHRWQRGDVIVWDNRAVLHALVGDYGHHDRRMLRVTVGGDIPQ
jgi:taurine dioxygenase